jgi:hypothetical protein
MLLSGEVQPLLLKGVTEEIPSHQLTPGLYSRLVLVPVKTDGMRPVIRTTKTKQVGYSVEFVVSTSYS